MRTVCCVCQKMKRQEVWVKTQVNAKKRISHGYCPECYQETMQQVHGYFGNTGQSSKLAMVR